MESPHLLHQEANALIASDIVWFMFYIVLQQERNAVSKLPNPSLLWKTTPRQALTVLVHFGTNKLLIW